MGRFFKNQTRCWIHFFFRNHQYTIGNIELIDEHAFRTSR